MWEVRLMHEIAMRNALAVCNGINPDTYFTDTDSSMQYWHPSSYKFIGPIYWEYMNNKGHDRNSFNECKCSKK